jgi:hypothetical protein
MTNAIASLGVALRLFFTTVGWALRVGLLLVVAGGLLGGSGWIPSAHAQAEGPSLRSTQRPVRVAVDPTYQYYKTAGGQVLTELSTRLSASAPITQQFSVQAQAAYAQMTGDADGLPQVQGLTDVSTQLNYAQPAGEGSVVMSLRANLPTGKQGLRRDEREVTRLISQNFYDFRVSSFSRGFSVSPKVTWAYPITDRLAVGVGGSYQHQRGFQPNAGLSSDSLYVPGDGVGASVGTDYKITESSALGLDVSFRRYGADEVGGTQLFEAGNRISGTLRYLRRSGFTTLRAVIGYLKWEESRFGFRGGNPTEGQVIPSSGLALASYQTRLSEGMRLHVQASGHWYGETEQEGPQGEQKILGRAYVAPSFDVADMLTLEPHGTVTFGSYLGIGGGVRVVGEF